jgi:hypothetical protein
MTTTPIPTVSLARLTLCFAPLFLLGCLDDDAALPTVAEDPFTDSSQQTERSSVGQQATLLTIDLMTYPDAKCNDGSAPVVKINLDPNGGTNWLVYLQGGGSCTSVASCEHRWQDCDPSPLHSSGGKAVGGKANMMANTNGMNFDNHGILDFDGYGIETSPFAGKGFNRVYIPYCSSDTWRGLGNSHSVNYAATCGGPATLTTLHFGGGKIVEAVIDQIMASQRAPQAGDFIVLGGGSAGGEGVQHNLERVASQAQTFEPDVTVVGIADADFAVGLDQDGIPASASLDSELFWAGLTLPVIRTPGDPIDVVVDDSCWINETGGDKDYCHTTAYMISNHVDVPLMLTSNTYDVGHDNVFANVSSFWPSACGVTVNDTGGLDPDQDALYWAYCNPGANPDADIETWMRYQIGAEGTAILDTTMNLAYYIVHSRMDLHDALLKTSASFYRRASSPEPLNDIGAYAFAGLGLWASASGQNNNPSVASTVACALGLVGLPGSPICVLADARVTSTLPTQVPVLENYLN